MARNRLLVDSCKYLIYFALALTLQTIQLIIYKCEVCGQIKMIGKFTLFVLDDKPFFSKFLYICRLPSESWLDARDSDIWLAPRKTIPFILDATK